MRRPSLIAHRGDSAHAPENTLRAFAQAAAKGADRIELDVQLSRDGRVFVFHDFELERLTAAQGLAANLGLDELRTLHVKSEHAQPEADTRICSLDEVLERVELPLYVELKSDQLGRRNPANALLLQACLRTLGEDADHVLASFDVDLVRGAIEAGRRPVLIAADPRRIDDLRPGEQSQLRAFSLQQRYVDAPLGRRLHDMGVEFWAWTVDRPEHRERMIEAGVQAWCANDVGAARQWIDAREWD